MLTVDASFAQRGGSSLDESFSGQLIFRFHLREHSRSFIVIPFVVIQTPTKFPKKISKIEKKKLNFKKN
jgi:hypothetical protein